MPHRSRLSTFVIDCRTDNLSDALRFWPAALGVDVEDVRRVAHFATPAHEPRLDLHAVDHDPRIHLDIETDDKAAEIARLERLGARVVRTHPAGFTVVEAPTGHRFCVVDPHRPDFAQAAPVREP